MMGPISQGSMKSKLKEETFKVHLCHFCSVFDPVGIIREELAFNQGGPFSWGGDCGGWSSFPYIHSLFTSHNTLEVASLIFILQVRKTG